MNKKLLTQAITLGLLVAAPYNVWAANNYGIKADEVAVNGNELFPNGVISDVKEGIYAKIKLISLWQILKSMLKNMVYTLQVAVILI